MRKIPSAKAKGFKPAVSVRAVPGPRTDLLEMAEVIAMLKTTRPTFYRWVRAGKLKGTKVGRQWRFRREDVDRFLRGQEPQIDLPADITPLIASLVARLKESGAGKGGLSKQEGELAQAVELMILLAARMRATELHLDPQPNGVASLRCRLDGALQPITKFDKRLLPALIKQWKTLAGCNVHEMERPQDGRIVMKRGNQELDLRVAFLPAVLGEAVTACRVYGQSALADLAGIGFAAGDQKKLQHRLGSPWGMIIVTGPAACGKTTTLYACLNHISKENSARKVMTVEDPVECLLPGTTQIPVKAAANVSFNTALRAVVKSAPDVIMVGEIRDLETLTLAQQMALSGRLVLINLHTTEAVTALQRMIAVGASPFMVADSTKLVVGQRLVRCLCQKCAIARQPVAQFLALAQKLAPVCGLNALPGNYREPVGCKECNMTGFRGRMLLAEVLEVTPRICAALNRGAGVADLRAIAISEGMTTLGAAGLQRAAQGITSLTEVLRVISPIYAAEFGGGLT